MTLDDPTVTEENNPAVTEGEPAQPEPPTEPEEPDDDDAE